MTRLFTYILEKRGNYIIVVGWNAISHKIIWAERVIKEAELGNTLNTDTVVNAQTLLGHCLEFGHYLL